MESLSFVLEFIALKDVIDITIVTLLIYQTLIIARGTRAFQMLLGILSLFALFWIGSALKLYAINWILGHFLDSFFIIIVILFQDQIRSTIARLGMGRQVFSIFSKNVEVDYLEEVIEAAKVLSKEKIGMLLVIERNQGLSNYIETGTEIRGELHSDLIYAIFQSSSPLHDGAVIISGDTILAAGCFLPLSKNIDIERHMGTRHRAALGISEDTDAVTVVVSEETGQISISYNGKLEGCEDLYELRNKLNKLLVNAEALERISKAVRVE